MSAHPLLLRLLLMAVFFHTAIGMPLHGARHLRATAAVVSHIHAKDVCSTADTAPTGHHERAHHLCAWCHAYAEVGDGLLPGIGQPVADSTRGSAVAVHTGVAQAHPGHWRFASRDPPRGAAVAVG